MCQADSKRQKKVCQYPVSQTQLDDFVLFPVSCRLSIVSTVNRSFATQADEIPNASQSMSPQMPLMESIRPEIQSLVDKIASLSLLETSELVRALKVSQSYPEWK